MLKLLVVGGAGHVARIVRPALEAAFDCRYFDQRPIPELGDRAIQADVNDDAAVAAALQGIEAVLYLAMGTVNHDPRTVGNIDVAFNVNVRGLYRFLLHASQAGIKRFVYASTLSVYKSLTREQNLMTEALEPSAWEAYGMSKRLGENLCRAAVQEYPDMYVAGLRLMMPRDEESWPRYRYDPAQAYNTCGLGPKDTARLFVAACQLYRPGCHIVQATGDLEQKRFSHRQVQALLDWLPRNE